MADASPNPAPRRKRKWLIILGAVVVVIVVLIALIPTLISAGLGQGLIRNAINKSINGSVAIDRLNLGWLSGQKVQGLTITDPSGKQAAKFDVQIKSGLLSVLIRRPGPLDVTVSGKLDGEIRPDGSISFGDLLASKTKTAKTSAPKPPRQPNQPVNVPPTTIHINGLTLNLTDQRTLPVQTIALDNLTGQVQYSDSVQPITVDLHGKTVAGNAAPGTFDLTAQATNLLSPGGGLTLRGASAKLDLDAKSIPLPALPGQPTAPTQLESMTLTLVSGDLTGKINIDMKADAHIQGHDPSHIETQIALSNILTSHGELTMRSATAHINAQLQNVPIVAKDINGNVQSFTATLASDDLTKTLTLALNGDGQVEGQKPSTLAGNLSIDELFTPEGKAQFSIDKVTGSIKGTTIPTAIVQPMLSATPIVLTRDVGPTVDVDATFSAGAKRDIAMTVVGSLARLEIKANVDQASQAITGDHLLLSIPAAQPELIRGFTKLVVDRPTDLEVNLTSFSKPAGNTQSMAKYAAVGTVKINGPITMQLPAGSASAANDPGAKPPAATAPSATIPVSLQNVVVGVDSPGLGDHLKIEGSALVDGGKLSFNETITNILDSNGQLAPMNAAPVGTITVDKLPATTLAKFAPDQKQIIDEVIGQSLNTTMQTSMNGQTLQADVQATGTALNAKIDASRLGSALTVMGGRVEMTVSPKLAALVQKSSDKPIVLTKPANAVVDLQQIDFEQDAQGRYQRADKPVNATLTILSMVFDKVPSVAEPVMMSDIVAEMTLAREGSYQAYSVNGDVTLHRANGEQLICRSRYNIKVKSKIDPITQQQIIIPHLDLGLADLSAAQLEAALGKQPGALSQWTGDHGVMALHVDATNYTGKEAVVTYQASIHSEMPNIKGDFNATSDGNIVAITAETSTLTLSREAIEQRMNAAGTGGAGGADGADDTDEPGPAPAPKPAKPEKPKKKPTAGLSGVQKSATDRKQAAVEKQQQEAEAPPPDAQQPSPVAPSSSMVKVESDVPLSLEIETLQFPLALIENKPFDPATVAMNIKFSGGPLKLVNPGGAKTSLSNLTMTLSATNLAGGITFALKGDADAIIPEAAESGPKQPAASQPKGKPGSLDITGKLVDLMSQDSTLHLETAKLQMNAKASSMPTAVADAVANMHGLLVAALGPQMNASFVADDFSLSFSSGQLDGRLDATNGWMEALVRGKAHSLRSTKTKPITGELNITAPLRERLLQKIHPILADIRTTEHPLRISMPYAVLPTDGDISKLKADISIDVGKVEFDSGSTTLTVLSFVNKNENHKTIPGEIEPISARIRNGIVKYEKFSVHIDQYTMNYFGEINLVKDTVDLHTEVPLKALGDAFPELNAYADKINVPLVTRGKFGDLKTQIDPKFDIGKAAIDAGFKGSLDQLLKGKDGKGGLLDDLIKGIGNKNKDKGGKP